MSPDRGRTGNRKPETETGKGNRKSGKRKAESGGDRDRDLGLFGKATRGDCAIQAGNQESDDDRHFDIDPQK
jgi:hypothetical protein